MGQRWELCHQGALKADVSKRIKGNSCCGSAGYEPDSYPQDVGLIPGLAQWIKGLVWLWLWRRPAAAALIRPPAGELRYAAGVTLKKEKRKKIPAFKGERFRGIKYIPSQGSENTTSIHP